MRVSVCTVRLCIGEIRKFFLGKPMTTELNMKIYMVEAVGDWDRKYNVENGYIFNCIVKLLGKIMKMGKEDKALILF